jgi:hypothetical protein
MPNRKVRYAIGILLLALIGYGIGYGVGKLFDGPSDAQIEAQNQPIPSFQQ